MTQSLKTRIGVLEGKQPSRKQVVVVCLPGQEEEALLQHPEYSDTERFDVVLVVSTIPRDPGDPCPKVRTDA